jgi:RNA polymerase sigma-70 factor (ECF subfamily)
MAGFHTTRWSLVLAARADDGQRALAELCRDYREAVLAYVRCLGHRGADAEDLTQGFFLKFLEKRYDAGADPARGRFRSWLLCALKGYLANVQDAALAARRGGGQPAQALDELTDSAALTDAARGPEQAFEHAWALALVGRALTRLRAEALAAGHAERYTALALYVVDPPASGDYRELAQRWQVPANTLAVQVRRWRERLNALIRAELSDTVSSPAQVDAELEALQRALR